MSVEYKRGSKDYQIQKANQAISDLIYDKVAIRKAYNYYHGKMDLDQYKHFEENYGIGTPTQIQFIPLIKKHIDYLVGKFLDAPLNMQITCKDQKTLSLINRERQLKVLDGVRELYMSNLYNTILSKFGDQNTPVTKDPLTEKSLQLLKEDIDKNFISEYEIAAQNIITYLSQSKSIDLDIKARLLMTDLLISGTLYFKTQPSRSGNNVDIEGLNPINTFVEKNPNSYYLNKSPRAVCRYYMTVDQILSKYNSELTESDKTKLRDELEKSYYTDNQKYIIRSTGPINAATTEDSEFATGILGGLEVTPVWDGNTGMYGYNNRLITVYEVEYIETGKDGVMHRYSVVKIASDIYIVRDVDLNVVRSMDNPKECTLSVNGLFMTTRQNIPFSLVLATADLQDMYNILFFLRNNAIAVSGTKGIAVDFSKIPTFLDEEDETNRLLKFMAYVKQGFAALDTSQSEAGQSMPNAVFNTYDMSLSYQSMQALDLAIEKIEQLASNITGAFREAIGGVETRDAVTNVRTGINQSLIVTKIYFSNMALALRELFLDSLNIAKVVYKDGFQGTIILGEKQKAIFTALPEHYTVTDFDINIADTQSALQDLETIKAYNLELIKSGQLTADVLVQAIGCKSITEYKQITLDAIKRQKEENNQIQQAQQQIQQYDQALKEAQQQIQQLQEELQKSIKEVENLKQKEQDSSIKWFTAKSKDENDKERNKIEEKKANIEWAQLFDNNPRNNEVNFGK